MVFKIAFNVTNCIYREGVSGQEGVGWEEGSQRQALKTQKAVLYLQSVTYVCKLIQSKGMPRLPIGEFWYPVHPINGPQEKQR